MAGAWVKALAVVAMAVATGMSSGTLAQQGTTTVPAAPALAEQASAWQEVISGQIAAFRAGDGDKALSFASAPFREGFTDPTQFLMAIASWGYGPLMTSRSESFGDYSLVAPDEVVQAVTVVGEDMRVYRVVYDLLLEADGWRVKAVQMQKTDGMGA